MLRRALLAASASTRTRDLLTAAPVTRDVVTRFVAGDTASEVLDVSQRLIADGLLVSIDYLGEHTTDRAQAAATAEEYVRLLGELGRTGLAAGGRAEVSVKPTAVGLGLPEHGEKTALENVVRIAVAARNAGTTVTVDMEDHGWIDATLRLVAELRADFPDLGCVIQSYLSRSADDCRALASAGSRVRLCKGAYSAPEPDALASPHEVDLSYARCLRILVDGPGYPMLATHDPRLIQLAGTKADMAGRDRSSFEYQMLYGIRPAEQRRLAERPANLAFFMRALASRGR